MTPVLLHTKYQLPQPRPSLIHRPTLLEKLAVGLNRKLTLVSAPAGFGKTTLITDYIKRTPVASPPCNWCWFSLDDADNDPTAFFTYIIAALQTAVPNLGHAAASLLSSPQLPSPEPILTILCNEISQLNDHITLIIDDYHLITSPTIHQALTFWLDHLPPNLHLILTSRADPPLPLPRMRVRGELVEIRAADLRFTATEAADFLNQIAGLTLTPQEIAALERRTEGWVAGLQLAALSIQGQADIPAFIRAFTGSHIYILDYLAAEVLRQQPPDVLHFLQDTAVLDQLSAPLCTAVTDRSDSDALLLQIYRSNLFLEALDNNLNWFRFHALFREVLLVQLRQARPDDLPRLHRRASDWFAQGGQINRAMQHAFAADDIALAASLIEDHVEGYIGRSEYVTVRTWLEQLPPEIRRTSPRIVLADATILAVTGQLDQAERLIEETASLFENPQLSPELLGELALLQTILNRFRGRWDQSVQFGQQALTFLPTNRLAIRNKVLLNMLLSYFLLGDLSATESLLAEVKDDNTETYLVLALYIPLSHYYEGHLTQAIKEFHSLLNKAVTMPRLPFVPYGLAHELLGDIAYEQDNLPEAINYLSHAMSHLKNSIEQIALARTAGKLALAKLALIKRSATGDPSAVFDSFNQISGWGEQLRLVDLDFSILLAYYQAMVYLQMGDIETAVRTISGHKLPKLTISRAEEYLIHTHLLLAQKRPQEALDILDQVEQESTKRKWNGLQIEINSQQALAWSALGDKSAALAALAAILPFAEQEGYRRVFLDKGPAMQRLLETARHQGICPQYIDTLLPAFTTGPSRPPASTLLPDPLTEREMEILEWVATGAANKDIASRLFIAPSTVKKHMSNILVKLDVTNRTQAIARARELGLI